MSPVTSENPPGVVNVSASDSATLTDASTLTPDERLDYLMAIERAARALVENGTNASEFMRLWFDLSTVVRSMAAPEPPAIMTRGELIALTEDAEQYLLEHSYMDEYEHDKRRRDETRAAIAHAREIITRIQNATIKPDSD